MQSPTQFSKTIFEKKFQLLGRVAQFAALVACAVLWLSGNGLAQGGTLSTYAGLNTTVKMENPTAAPDPTIAVGTLEYCEHVNSAYQCWYKSGTKANQAVFAAPKTDAGR